MTAVRPIPGSGLASFLGTGASEGSLSEHVFFVGLDKGLHELRFDGTWHDDTLTKAEGVRPPATDTPLTGFWEAPSGDGANAARFGHIFYLDVDGQLCELLHDRREWRTHPVPSQPFVTQAASGSPLTSFFGGRQRRENVLSIGKDGHLHESWFDGHKWHSNDLSMDGKPAAWPSTSLGSPLTSFREALPSSGGAHAFYIGRDGHIYELQFDGARWLSRNLTLVARPASPPATAPISPLTSFGGSLPGSETPTGTGPHRAGRVFYLGKDGHVHQLWSDGRAWHAGDVTAETVPTAGPLPSPTSPLTGFCGPSAPTGENLENVFYIGKDGDIHELWFDGEDWHHHDVTAAAGPDADVPALTPMTPLASYNWPEDGTEHVFYIGAKGDLWELWYDGTWHATDLTRSV